MLAPAMASLLVVCAGVGHLISEHHGARTGHLALTVSTRPARPGRQAGAGTHTTDFMVTNTGTRYRKSTLPTQVRDRLASQVNIQAVHPAQPTSGPAPTAWPGTLPPTTAPYPFGVPGVSFPASTPNSITPAIAVAPSRSLVGCVMHLTGDIPPAFVDRATYQSQPVYVIAISDEAWVVGIGCTAAQPALITSVNLSTVG
jgi:hypothetical protein